MLVARRLCLLAFALIFASPLVAPGQSENFEVVKITEGVYAAVRREPPGLAFDANVTFIINAEDVVVVDSNVTPSSAKEVLAALRRLTQKPVKYVVNTHWHDDHHMGNQVYRDAFPNVEFIGHTTTREDLSTTGASNRKQLIAGAPQIVAQLRGLVEQNKSLTGRALTDEERASHLSDIRWAERYLSEAPSFQIIFPTIAVEERLTLYRGNRTIEIRHLGRAHTRADLVVHLPQEGIVIAGDLVVWPVPLVGSTSYPLDYGATLEKLLALKPAVIIPGHGPIMRDDSYVKLMIRLLASLKQQTEAAVARGETLEQARKSVNLEEFRKAFAGESQLRSVIFNMYVTSSGVAAAFRQTTTKQ